jgi:formate-dependent nitrite reductase membrane component NrfD
MRMIAGALSALVVVLLVILLIRSDDPTRRAVRDMTRWDWLCSVTFLLLAGFFLLPHLLVGGGD